MKGDDLYLIRDFVPDFDAIASEFAARSRALSGRSKLRADIAYGHRPREVLDVAFPERQAAGAPLHVFVHGGYWRSGEKADYRFVAEPVLAAGGVAALVEYDLMPGERLEVLVGQVRRALHWLHQHASDFGADPFRITVSGHSAGAHLASFLAATGPAETEAPGAPALHAMMLVSGIYELSGIPGSFLRDEARMTAEEAADWSPLGSTHHSGPRRVLAYGGNETAPFLDQAQALHDALQGEGQPVDLVAAPGLNHMSVVLDLGDPKGGLGQRLADMVALS
ncbi:alpha/beta hydrolase [Mesorhizobium sp. CAU 1741]|uniref:alpha/beta hydrolase n=1 Tax=Mesorhizobium sp. CAU 1741 TaxID=3140366 RepID=UPI00325B0535